MEIRKVAQADIDAIQKLNKELFNFEEQFGHEYNLNWTYGEAGKKYFEDRLHNENSIIFVAEEGKRVVGYIIAFVNNYTYRRVNPICEIENMLVEEEFRGHGVGKALIEAVKHEVKKKSVKRLRVGAIAQNEKAINFYRAQGFKDTNIYLEENL